MSQLFPFGVVRGVLVTKFKSKFAVVSALIATLLLLNVLLGVSLSSSASPNDGLFIAIALGLLIGQYIGQLNLISVWAAVSSGSVIVRLPWALLLSVIMWASLVLGQQAARWSGDVLEIGVMLGYGCLVTQVPLWIASRAFRWQLVATDDDPNELAGQFNLQQMFVGTVLLAGTLSICRWLLSDLDWSRFWSLVALPWDAWVFLAPLSFFNLLFVVPSIWAAFLVTPTSRRMLIGTGLLSLVGPIELLVICIGVGDTPNANEFLEWMLFFSMLHLGQVFAVFGSLLLLKHVAGFRLIRVDDSVTLGNKPVTPDKPRDQSYT